MRSFRNQQSHRAIRLRLLFRLDPNVLDGRYANNGWIQELPRPFSKLTWDNAAIVSPALAQRMDLQNGDVVEMAFQGRKLLAPVWIQPGQAANSVTLHLGYGRAAAGRVGNNVGFNAYALRSSSALWFGDGVTHAQDRRSRGMSLPRRSSIMRSKAATFSGPARLLNFKRIRSSLERKRKSRNRTRHSIIQMNSRSRDTPGGW